MKTHKALQVVETAYDVDSPGTDWLRQTAERAAALVEGVHAAYALRFRVPPGTWRSSRPTFLASTIPCRSSSRSIAA